VRTLVVDASVALKWLVLEDMSDVAARRLDAQLVTADRRFTSKIAGTDLARQVTLLSDWRPE
jgi:predicted nucleic acid-binding protein